MIPEPILFLLIGKSVKFNLNFNVSRPNMIMISSSIIYLLCDLSIPFSYMAYLSGTLSCRSGFFIGESALAVSLTITFMTFPRNF